MPRAGCLRDAVQGMGSEVWLFQMSDPQRGNAPRVHKRPQAPALWVETRIGVCGVATLGNG